MPAKLIKIFKKRKKNQKYNCKMTKISSFSLLFFIYPAYLCEMLVAKRALDSQHSIIEEETDEKSFAVCQIVIFTEYGVPFI